MIGVWSIGIALVDQTDNLLFIIGMWKGKWLWLGVGAVLFFLFSEYTLVNRVENHNPDNSGNYPHNNHNNNLVSNNNDKNGNLPDNRNWKAKTQERAIIPCNQEGNYSSIS